MLIFFYQQDEHDDRMKTMVDNYNIPCRAVQDSEGGMIRVGDHVRHLRFGRDAIVKRPYIAVRGGIRYDEIAIVEAGGPWDPKDVRKL